MVLAVALTEWLENTAMAIAMRQSSWLYPATEIVHILGIVLVSGSAILFDIQLLSSRTSNSTLNKRYLLTWSKRGLYLVVPSGLLLFISNAATLAANPLMATKMLLLIVAGLNAWAFHLRAKTISNTTSESRPPYFHAVLSILLWISIIACGRLLAY